MLTDQIPLFRQTVWDYYHDHGRHDLPWRLAESDGSFDPYKIMVSELMLQQTQVSRVVPKYQLFLQQFPDLFKLAQAELGDVLRAWQGLGYNRRAKFLHQAAIKIVNEFDGIFPQTTTDLVRLPGVGVNTAGAIAAYAFNQKVIFIETNIRTVFIHHFFEDQEDIADNAIVELVQASLDPENPREWYWALMDYGSYLKQTVGNHNRRSLVYTKQSRFEGSKRQIRGEVLRRLGEQTMSSEQLRKHIADSRLDIVISDLLREGLIRKQGSKLAL